MAMIWDSILTKLVGTLPEAVVKHYTAKQQLIHERELEVIRGKIAYEAAKTVRAAESEGHDHEWELESIKNSGWKDEWVLILLSIPLVLVFIPATQEGILHGFAVLDTTPEWYRWLIMLIFTAIYGIRIWRRPS